MSAGRAVIDLAAIRARCEAATPGPWRYDGDNTVHADKVGVIVVQILDHPQDDGPYEPEQIDERFAWYNQSARNADFIEAAREDIPALLTALEAAQAEIAVLRSHVPTDEETEIIENSADVIEGLSSYTPAGQQDAHERATALRTLAARQKGPTDE